MYERAARLIPNGRILFNKALVYVRLDDLEAAEAALREALDMERAAEPRDKELAGRCHAAVSHIRSAGRPQIWWDWWFTQGETPRRLLGGFLLGLLAVILVSTLVTLNLDLFAKEERVWWTNFGQTWEHSAVPVAAILILLLSPMLREIAPKQLHLQPFDSLEGGA